MTDVAAVVAAAAGSRGIGHQGKLVSWVVVSSCASCGAHIVIIVIVSLQLRSSTLTIIDLSAILLAVQHRHSNTTNALSLLQTYTQPWRLPGDMNHFKKVTTTPPSPGLTNAVIMGRKTWDSIPSKFRPLDGRVNVILSRKGAAGVEGVPMSTDDNNNNNNAEDVLVASSLEEAMQKLDGRANHGSTFIIGGGEIYSQGIKSGLVTRVIYTNVKGLAEDAKLDAFFPELTDSEWECVPFTPKDNAENEETENSHVSKKAKVAEEHEDAKSGLKYEFLEYIRRDNVVTDSPSESNGAIAAKNEAEKEDIPEGADVNPEEMQYLEICRDIIENGVRRGDRTGTGTLSKFGVQMRYSLRDNTLPLLTTKRTFWRGVAEELLWFVKVSCIVFWRGTITVICQKVSHLVNTI